MRDPTAEPQNHSQDEIMAAFRARRWEPESERSHWLLAVTVVAGLLGLGWWGLSASERSGRMNPADDVPDVAVVDHDVTEETSAPAAPVNAGPVREEVPWVTAVYECQHSGQKVFSDLPCGSGAVQRDLAARQINTYSETPRVSVGGSAGSVPAPRVASPGSSGSAGSGVDRRAQCQALQNRIDAINARTRQKHTHREAEYWRGEWHKAKNAYYDARCGR